MTLFKTTGIRRGTAAALTVGALLAGTTSALAQDVVIAQSTDATSMDPAFRGDTATGNVQKHIFDTVLQRGPDMEIGPALATSVEQVKPDQWRVNLREEVTFSNGEPFDAEAVKFSIERARSDELAAPTQGWWTGFTEVRVEDPQTLLITTDGPDPLFRARMTLLAPVPPQYMEEVGPDGFAREPIGTGPYLLDEWRQGEYATLKANPDYWGEAPSIPEVTFRVVPEELSRVSALRTGEADVIAGVSPTQAASLEGGGEGLTVGRAPGTRVMVIQFDDTVAPGDNETFRKAVSHAIDRETIIQGMLKGYGAPVNSILSPGVPEWPKDTDYTAAFDTDQASQMFGELDLQEPVVLRAPSGRYPNDRQTALAVGQMLTDAGLEVDVRPQEWGRFFEDLKAGEMSSLYLMGQGNVWLDPYPQIEAFHATDGFLSTWADGSLDELLAKSNEVAPEERPEVFGEALARIQETAAAVPLYAIEVLYGIGPDVEWQPRPDEQVLATEMTLKESAGE